MFKKKQIPSNPTETHISGMDKSVVFKSVRHGRFGLDKTQLVIVLMVFVSLIGAAAFVAYKQITDDNTRQQVSDAAVVASSYDAINNKDYQTAVKSISDQLKTNIENDEDRYQALSNLGIAYLAQKEYDKSLETLLQAESIKKDATAADVQAYIARLYETKGDNAKAIEYYKKAIARLKATPEMADDGYAPNYELAIKKLGGTP